MKNFIPVNEPLLDGNEKKYLIECIDTGWISSEGSFVRQFEEKISDRLGRKFGIAVCNGTSALETAVAALDMEPGAEILMPTFTIISCAAAVIRAGYIPVLVDCDPDTWNMDIGHVEARLTHRTKAIMIVHIYGMPVDMDPILQLAEKHGLKVIEDAAEMLGQTYKGKPCGSFGHISALSFYSNKHITTGEGGMVLVDDEKVAERCRSLRNLSFQAHRRFVHNELGFNFRMTNLQAALGIAQLERLDEFVEKKRMMGKKYTSLLNDLQGIQLPVEKTDYAENIYWVFGIVLINDVQLDAADMMKLLADKRIGSRPFFWPMHEQPVFQKMGLFKNETYPVAESLARRGLYLPSGLALSENNLIMVSKAVKTIITENTK